MEPTIRQVMEAYRAAARIERAKCGRPGIRTERNAVNGARIVARAMAGDDALEMKFGAVGRRMLDRAIGRLVEKGTRRVTAWSYVCQFRSLAARWTLGYYEDLGWRVKPPEMPHFVMAPHHYERPPEEVLSAVKEWYRNLEGEERFAAAMMLEFGMRNGDVMRLKRENFVCRDGRWYLSYTPHKTSLSSGRRVFWPVTEAQKEELGVPGRTGVRPEVFERLNRQLRGLGLKGSKACYELRKICIDHVYQRYGAEMAVSISGDDIRTISRYYADPAQPNLGNQRVLDLL